MRTPALLLLGAALFFLPSAGAATSLMDENGIPAELEVAISDDLQLGTESSPSALETFGVSVTEMSLDGEGEVAASSFGGAFLISLFRNFHFYLFYHDFFHGKRCSHPIPEPHAAAVFGLGAMMVAATTRRRTRS